MPTVSAMAMAIAIKAKIASTIPAMAPGKGVGERLILSDSTDELGYSWKLHVYLVILALSLPLFHSLDLPFFLSKSHTHFSNSPPDSPGPIIRISNK